MEQEVFEPLDPDEHEKPIQPGTDMSLGHGQYLESQEDQDAAWATAVTPEGETHPDANNPTSP